MTFVMFLIHVMIQYIPIARTGLSVSIILYFASSLKTQSVLTHKQAKELGEHVVDNDVADLIFTVGRRVLIC